MSQAATAWDAPPRWQLPHALLCRIFELVPANTNVLLVSKEWCAAAQDTPSWWRELLKAAAGWGYCPSDSHTSGPGEQEVEFLSSTSMQYDAAAVLRGLKRQGVHARTLWADPTRVVTRGPPLPLPRLLDAARSSCPTLACLCARLHFPGSNGTQEAKEAVQAVAGLTMLTRLRLAVIGVPGGRTGPATASWAPLLTPLSALTRLCDLDLSPGGTLGPSLLSPLTKLTRLCVTCDGTGPVLPEVGWLAADGTGPRLRSLELEHCALAGGSATRQAVQHLQSVRLVSARGAAALADVLPAAAALTALRMETPYELGGEMLDQEMEAAVMILGVACTAPAVQELEIGRYQLCFSYFAVQGDDLFSALTSLRLSYTCGPELLPDWCCPPSLISLEVTASLNVNDCPAAELPPAFSTLQRLQALDLQMVGFGGTLPPALGVLGGLTRLGISLATLQDHQALAASAFLPRLRELVLWQEQGPEVVAPLPLPKGIAGAASLEVLDCGPCMDGLLLRDCDGDMLCMLPALRRVILPAPEPKAPAEHEGGADEGDADVADADVVHVRQQRAVLDRLAAELSAAKVQVEESMEGHPFYAPVRLTFAGLPGWVAPPPGFTFRK